MLTRFNGNVVPFADDATSTNRTVFGGTTQSDDIDDNLNADFKKGWEIVGLNDNPTREDFNAMGYTLGALISYLYEMGISEWNTSQKYRVNSRVIGSDGKIYKALTGTSGTPNVGNNPLSDVVNWGIDNQFYINSLASKATPIDTDNFGIQETGGLFKKLSWANLKAGLNSLYVGLTGNQDVGGVKKFSSSPIVPTPTTGTQAVNKDYADLKVALAGFTGANVSLASNGYQKLPSGLIIQWGESAGYFDVLYNDIAFTFPIAFPTSCLNISATMQTNGTGSNHSASYVQNNTKSTTGFSVLCEEWGGGVQQTKISWIAIGY